MRPLALLAAFLCVCAPLRAQEPSAPLPAPLDQARLQRMLQDFVDTEYLKAFRHLGDERDFDHGHLLFDARTHEPAAILYHTQELAYYEPKGSAYGFVDASARNWIQWIAQPGRIENADRYVRALYPSGGAWDWFTKMELPGLRQHRTILYKMLDPKLLGFDDTRTEQWVFTRESCSSAAGLLRVVLPTREPICLSLSKT